VAKRSGDTASNCGQSFQSSVALRFPPQSKKIWLRLRRAVFSCSSLAGYLLSGGTAGAGLVAGWFVPAAFRALAASV
jgi:hypothetical protein